MTRILEKVRKNKEQPVYDFASLVREIVKQIASIREDLIPIKGIDYMTRQEVRELADRTYEFLKERVPKKGIDYFTRSEVQQFLEDVTPIKGIHYNDGKRGEKGDKGDKGELADEKVIIEEVSEKVMASIIAKKEDRDAEIILDKLMTLPSNKLEKLFLKFPAQSSSWSKTKLRHGGGDTVQYYDLSSSLNGVTKVFTIPKNRRVLGVWASSFPNALRPTTDWTSTSTSLTFTSEINAASVLASGQTIFLIYVQN